ncbi:LytTR family DNA-binding domain-containing protein [Neorhizobium sp. JUb45]|uniref:LytR/AlgR family response regulator transcription factor n=1 Tax=unclassified Neorhizobium TaxID=2629175 RepID=UPI0010446901|nr:LytTR family DNA-binding domain-containing protein [Neorhizobium sp. JUb45]TCQ98224.1 LytTR family two component transcriptional regulator [Neorhizobium sp. JUb45]
MKALIVEDEYLARDELAWLIENHSSIKVEGSEEDGLAALRYLQGHDLDVVFLDINIPSIDGMTLARTLKKQANPPLVVMVTASKEHAAEAFELEVFDYILKPFNEQRVANTLRKLEASRTTPVAVPAPAISQAKRTVNIQRKDSIIVLPSDLIYYTRADEKLTYVHTARGHYVIPTSIGDFVEKLPGDTFFRCHRSWCINISKIREISPWFNGTYVIKLHNFDDVEIPVSRSHLKEFKQLMLL